MRFLPLAATTLLFTTATTASAANCRTANPYAERAAFGTAIGITGAGGIVFGVAAGIEPNEGEPTWIPPIDRNVPTEVNQRNALASDILLYTGLAAGAAGSLTSMFACGPGGDTAFSWVNPLVEGTGTFLLTYGVTNITKVTVGRPRPYTRGGGSYTSDDDFESFWSGHTSLGAWGFTYGTAEMLRTTDLPWWGRALVGFGAGAAGGLITGSQRVAAGKHYWSDVLVGWAVGTSVGLVPTLLDPAWNRMADNRVAISGSASPHHVSLRMSGWW